MIIEKFIYALVDPRNESVFYIGQSKDVNIRLLNHLHKSYLLRTPKDKILTELVQEGKVPMVKILEVIKVDMKDKKSIFLVSEREKFWVNSTFGENSLNIQNKKRGVSNSKCEYCESPFYKKHKRGKFCSDKCRVYWNREHKLSVKKEKKVKEEASEKELSASIQKRIAEIRARKKPHWADKVKWAENIQKEIDELKQTV